MLWVVPEANNEGLSSSLHLSYIASLPLLLLDQIHPDMAVLGQSTEQDLKENLFL